MKVTYIWHDCFVVEQENVNLLFDYWRNPPTEAADALMPEAIATLDRDKPLVVYVSHGHKDHYNPRIFDWSREFKEVKYVVSKDVWQRMRHIASPTSAYRGVKVERENVYVLREGERCEFWGIETVACGSTDIGNSYLIRSEGKVIFHAGDLNAWVWRDESTEEEVAQALADYGRCVEGVKRELHGEMIDILFFPVDPRLGRDERLGLEIFLSQIPVRHIYPMHQSLPLTD